jgi:hypothetical protein
LKSSKAVILRDASALSMVSSDMASRVSSSCSGQRYGSSGLTKRPDVKIDVLDNLE